MMAIVVDGDKDKTRDHKEMRLASDAIIRNAEVLTSVKEKILSLASTGGDAQEMNLMIADFYDKIRDSEMETYPTASNEDPYTINFRFLGPISKALRETKEGHLYTLLMSLQVRRAMNKGSDMPSVTL